MKQMTVKGLNGQTHTKDNFTIDEMRLILESAARWLSTHKTTNTNYPFVENTINQIITPVPERKRKSNLYHWSGVDDYVFDKLAAILNIQLQPTDFYDHSDRFDREFYFNNEVKKIEQEAQLVDALVIVANHFNTNPLKITQMLGNIK